MNRIFALTISAAVLAISVGCSSAPRGSNATSAPQPARPAPAKPSTQANAPAPHGAHPPVECKRENDVRKLAIEESAPGCTLMYTKLAQTKAVASSKVGNAYCETKMAHIKEKLEASGFQCH